MSRNNSTMAMSARFAVSHQFIGGQSESPFVSCGSPLIDIGFEDDESGLLLDVFDLEMESHGMYSDNDFIERDADIRLF